MLESTKLLGVKITTSSEEKILEYINLELSKPKEKSTKVIIFTPNPEQIAAAANDPELKALLNKATIALPDGVGALLASKLLGNGIKARITGVDFMKSLVKGVASASRGNSNRPVIAGFLGGQSGVAEEAAECLQKMSKNLAIGYASESFDKDKMIRSDIDILFVGLGFPKQEKWIVDHMNEIPARVIMAVGGAFDFYSGRIPRAPKFVRSIGMEWLFRLMLQPQRIFRQLRLLKFSASILQEALNNRPRTDNRD